MVGRVFDAEEILSEVIGKARGALGRVGDYYTRDRSTPRRDEDFVSRERYFRLREIFWSNREVSRTW